MYYGHNCFQLSREFIPLLTCFKFDNFFLWMNTDLGDVCHILFLLCKMDGTI